MAAMHKICTDDGRTFRRSRANDATALAVDLVSNGAKTATVHYASGWTYSAARVDGDTWCSFTPPKQTSPGT